MATTRSLLLALPRELRDRIYDFLLVLPQGIIQIPERTKTHSHREPAVTSNALADDAEQPTADINDDDDIQRVWETAHDTAVEMQEAVDAVRAANTALSLVCRQSRNEARETNLEGNVFGAFITADVADEGLHLSDVQLEYVRRLLLYRYGCSKDGVLQSAYLIDVRSQHGIWKVELKVGPAGYPALEVVVDALRKESTLPDVAMSTVEMLRENLKPVLESLERRLRDDGSLTNESVKVAAKEAMAAEERLQKALDGEMKSNVR